MQDFPLASLFLYLSTMCLSPILPASPHLHQQSIAVSLIPPIPGPKSFSAPTSRRIRFVSEPLVEPSFELFVVCVIVAPRAGGS